MPYSYNYHRLHWSMTGIIIALLLADLQFNFNLTDAYRITGLQAHSTLGSLSLLIVLGLLFKRFIRRDPVPKPMLPLFKVLATRSVQNGLYTLAVVIPLSGLAASLYSPHPVYFLGIFDIAIMDIRQEVMNIILLTSLLTLNRKQRQCSIWMK
jgi:cytochrome b561